MEEGKKDTALTGRFSQPPVLPAAVWVWWGLKVKQHNSRGVFFCPFPKYSYKKNNELKLAEREGKRPAVRTGRIAPLPRTLTQVCQAPVLSPQLTVTDYLKHGRALQPLSLPIPLSFSWQSPLLQVSQEKILPSACVCGHCSRRGENIFNIVRPWELASPTFFLTWFLKIPCFSHKSKAYIKNLFSVLKLKASINFKIYF